MALWAFFIARELFRKGYFYDYRVLSQRSLDGKRSYVTGDRFYEFLMFCNKGLPQGAAFSFAGVEKDSIDIRRAAYYLYPHLQGLESEFVLVYDEPNVNRTGYGVYAKLDEQRYILKRRR